MTSNTTADCNLLMNASCNETEWTNKWSTFCSAETDRVCANITLSQCPTCSQFGFWIFFFLALLLALWILIGNSVVIAFLIQTNKTAWESIRISLAISDILTGLLILFIVLPNVVWTYNSTSFEIYQTVQRYRNSSVAVFGTLYILLSISSFMFHLAFMSYYRYSAIRTPIETKTTTQRVIALKLIMVWTLALVVATYTTWFPGLYHFGYYYFTFLYLPNIRPKNGRELSIAIGTVIPYLLSYIVMTVFTIATGLALRKHNRHMKLHKSTPTSTGLKRDKSPYIMLTLLELVFTISAFPAFVAYTIAPILGSYSIFQIVANYMLMTNGALNLVIYWKKDKKFKNYLKNSMKKIQKNQSSPYSETSSTYMKK